MEKQLKPAIRFKGFADAWEQRKLINEVSSVDTGKSKFASHESGKYEILGSTSVIGYDNSYDYEGDFLLTARVGANAGELYRHSGKVKISDNTVFIQGSQLDFIYYALLNFDIKRLSFGTGQPLVKASELKEQIISMPTSKIERECIGKYFCQLDHLITLHQRKYDKLQVVKKAMLEKMFPKNGSNVPEIRFRGFTDAWEQRKLGELYTERNEQGNKSLQILSVSIHSGVSDGELDVDGLGKKVRRSEDKSTYKHVYAGDLIFNMMRAWQGAIGVSKNEGMTSPAYISAIPNEEVYPPFMNYLLRRKDAINQINNLSYGVTDFRKRLYWNSFVRVTCQLPCVAEQKRITETFENLDHLITLHQRELEKLQNIKKSMLEKMFV